MISLFIAVATTVTAQQTLTNQQRYENFLEQYNQRLIDQTIEKLAKAERLLDALKKRKTHGKAEKRDVRQKKKTVGDKIKAHKRDLAKLKRQKKTKRYEQGRPPITLHFLSGLWIGFIGPLWEGANKETPNEISVSYRTLSIIDEDEMLIRLEYSWTWGIGASMRLKEKTSSPVLLRGVPTTGIVNDQLLDIAGDYFEITGSHQYTTTLGSTNTVFVLEPFDTTGITP